MEGKSGGTLLAVMSAIMIGTSFMVKKRGLQFAGSSGGLRAGSGGFSYLQQPMWWAGMLTMLFGEASNFAAYALAPAVLVTPLGALSILVSSVLSDRFLGEKLDFSGWLGALLCCTGTVIIVVHAPEEQPINGVKALAQMARTPEFEVYAALAVSIASVLALLASPPSATTAAPNTLHHSKVQQHKQSSTLMMLLAVCSLFGSLSVLACKALGIALKLTLFGTENQLVYPETWLCAAAACCFLIIQVNYLVCLLLIH